jgi:hypothetical protein
LARKGHDLDVLLGMGHRELAQMAYTLFRCIEATEPYAYLISGLQGHLEGPGSHQEGYVIAQADGGGNEGGFNKWCKVRGGHTYDSGPSGDTFGPCGDALVFFTWKEAKEAYDHFMLSNPEVAKCFRIYPVVITAGNEPRTTIPADEAKS